MERLANFTRSIEQRRGIATNNLVCYPDRTIIVRKEGRLTDTRGLEFILSDESVDRVGDVIRADGWLLTNFKKNPIALFQHRADFPLGTWKNLRVENKSLIGKLEMAPVGTSDRIDEVRRLVQAGVLRATSVGFHPLESRPRGPDAPGGIEFIRQELMETSLVSVPANPNAVAIAKSIGISEEVRRLVFAVCGARGGRDGKAAPVTRQADVIINLDARIARLYAKAQDVRAELEKLISSQQKCSAAAREAVDSVQFFGSPEIRALRDESLSHECMREIGRLRDAEIAGKALDAPIARTVDQLRRLEGQLAMLRESRRLLQKR